MLRAILFGEHLCPFRISPSPKGPSRLLCHMAQETAAMRSKAAMSVAQLLFAVTIIGAIINETRLTYTFCAQMSYVI